MLLLRSWTNSSLCSLSTSAGVMDLQYFLSWKVALLLLLSKALFFFFVTTILMISVKKNLLETTGSKQNVFSTAPRHKCRGTLVICLLH